MHMSFVIFVLFIANFKCNQSVNEAKQLFKELSAYKKLTNQTPAASNNCYIILAKVIQVVIVFKSVNSGKDFDAEIE